MNIHERHLHASANSACLFNVVSLNILLSDSSAFEMTLLSTVGRVLVTISISLNLCLHVVPFLRYSASKKRRNLETGGKGCSRSLKLTPFDRSHATFYWFAIVNIALSGTVFELFDVE